MSNLIMFPTQPSLQAAVAEDERLRAEKFLKYAEVRGYETVDVNGESLPSAEIAWRALKAAGMVTSSGKARMGLYSVI